MRTVDSCALTPQRTPFATTAMPVRESTCSLAARAPTRQALCVTTEMCTTDDYRTETAMGVERKTAMMATSDGNGSRMFCDDGNVCSVVDECQGVCVGRTNACDGIPCTVDQCCATTASVMMAIPAPSIPVWKGLAVPWPIKSCATTEIPAIHKDGECHGTAVDCGDGNPPQSCNPVTGCQNVNNNAACDDDGGDVCAGGSCTPGVSNSCLAESPVPPTVVTR